MKPLLDAAKKGNANGNSGSPQSNAAECRKNLSDKEFDKEVTIFFMEPTQKTTDRDIPPEINRLTPHMSRGLPSLSALSAT